MSNNGDSYDRAGLYTFLGSVLFCLLFFGYISFVHENVTLDEIKEMKEATPGFNMAKVEKPWVESADIIAHGAKAFASAGCVACHGAKGLGDGAPMTPPARNLVEGKWKRGGTSEDLFLTLKEGLPGTAMASFAHISLSDRWAIVQFIRSITKNKTPDDAAKLEEFGAKEK